MTQIEESKLSRIYYSNPAPARYIDLSLSFNTNKRTLSVGDFSVCITSPSKKLPLVPQFQDLKFETNPMEAEQSDLSQEIEDGLKDFKSNPFSHWINWKQTGLPGARSVR